MSIFPRFIDDGGTLRPYADNASGTMELRHECCCDDCVPTESGSCANCDDVTPAQYTATISDHAMCGCVFYVGASDVNIQLNFALNAAHTLVHNGSCTWIKTITNGATYRDYASSDNSCTTLVSGPFNYDVQIILTRSASTWRLLVSITVSSTIFYIYDSGDVTSLVSGADELCASVPELPNSYVIGDCGDTAPQGWKVGYGGNATVVCV